MKSLRPEIGYTADTSNEIPSPPIPPTPPREPRSFEYKTTFGVLTIVACMLMASMAYTITTLREVETQYPEVGRELEVTKTATICNNWGIATHKILPLGNGVGNFTNGMLVAQKYSSGLVVLEAQLIAFNYTNNSAPEEFVDARLQIPLDWYSSFGRTASLDIVGPTTWGVTFLSTPITKGNVNTAYSYTVEVNETAVTWSSNVMSPLHFTVANHTVWGRLPSVQTSLNVGISCFSTRGGQWATQSFKITVNAPPAPPPDYSLNRNITIKLYEILGAWKQWNSKTQTDGVTWAMIKAGSLAINKNAIDSVTVNMNTFGIGYNTEGNLSFNIIKAINDWKNGTWNPANGFLVAIIAPWETTDYSWFSVSGYNSIGFLLRFPVKDVRLQIGFTEVIPEFELLIIPMFLLIMMVLIHRRKKE